MPSWVWVLAAVWLGLIVLLLLVLPRALARAGEACPPPDEATDGPSGD